MCIRDRLILTPGSSNPFFCRYRGSASAYFSYMICDTRDAEAYPPGISAGLPSSFMNRGSSVSLQAGHPQVVAMYTIRSVSYTHLDVYKRQIYGIELLHSFFRILYLVMVLNTMKDVHPNMHFVHCIIQVQN